MLKTTACLANWPALFASFPSTQTAVSHTDGPLKKSLALLLLLGAMACPCLLQAQAPSDENWRWGLSSGVNFSKIGNIRQMIIPRIYPDSTYEATENYRKWNFNGSAYLFRRFKESYVAFQPELSYSVQGGDFDYMDEDSISPKTYKMRFNYHYLNILPLFKFYPFYAREDLLSGLHFGLGPQLGLNVTNSKIRYTSTPDDTQDLDISDALSEVLKGRTDVQAVIELGYERYWEDKDVSFRLDGRWCLGLKDMVETQANGFYFREVDNASLNFQVSLGVTLLLAQ